MSTTTLQRAQNRLLLLWVIGSGMTFLVAFFKQLDPHATSMNKVWSWTMPSVIPTLLLIVGSRAGAALGAQTGKEKEVDQVFFRVTIAMSSFYLAAVFVTLWAAIHWSYDSLEFLATSSFYLGPLQGLTSASLGAFFVSRKRR